MPKEDLTVRESIVEKYLTNRLKSLRRTYPYINVLVKKIGGPGWRGWPDRMALFEPTIAEGMGAAHWLEVKRPKGSKFEPLQLRMHKNLRKLGFVVRVVNTKTLVDAYLDEVVQVGPQKMPVHDPSYRVVVRVVRRL